MSNPMFYQCIVLDNQDPLMLGRVRARIVTDNYEDILKSVNDPAWNPEKDPWTSRDPLVFNSLLPYFVYQVPKVDELIQVMFLNSDFKYQNQYYIQNGFSSPTSTLKEFNFGGNKFTGTGLQIENPKPLKNQNGTFSENGIHEGVFPQPGDNAILGRGSADVIVKQDEILLRAGKFKDDILQPNTMPVANPQRGFIQLTRFLSTKKSLEPKVYYEQEENVVLTKYLIEWVITNPENKMDLFSGTVYLYQLKPDVTVNTKNLTVGSVVSEKLKQLVSNENFSQLSKVDTIKFINDFIKTCNSKNVSSSGNILFSNNSADSKFPIFYRPNNLMYNKINSSPNGDEVKNLSEIYKGIKLNSAVPGGFGFILTQDKVSTTTPTTSVKKVVPQNKYINGSSTYGAMGADVVFLLSHNSQIPGKRKINFSDTLYGITTEKFSDDVMPNTSSMVRGEELIELISLIVRFLSSHTHSYPGLAPVPVTQDGSNINDILSELQNAANKILNKNIRLN
jgi:hypothetical protein